MWKLHIGRSRRDEDLEIVDFDEEPRREQRGDEVEWFGTKDGEDVYIAYNTNEVVFSFVFPPLTEEEKNSDGLIIRHTHFYDNG